MAECRRQSDERQLVLSARAGDAEARAALIDAFTPLMAGMARIHRGSLMVSRAELMQEGVAGLLRALERYDAVLGTPFWAYASWWVRHAMQRLVSELARPVVLSDRAARELARVKAAQRSHVQTHGKEPRTDELAASTGMNRTQVEHLLAAEAMPRRLEGSVDDEGGGGTFGDLLIDPRAEEAYEQVPLRLACAELPGMLSGLTGRECEIVRARFGLDGREQTLRELGGRLGVSAEHVRQIEQRALDKLRADADAGVDAERARPMYRA